MAKLKGKQIFFTSDLHWGHFSVIGFSKRPFKTLEEMHRRLISNWNKIVGENDLVYVLGDWAMYMSKEDLRKLMAELKGTKVLVRGNHDMSPTEMLNVGFHAVVEQAEIVIAGERVLLSHYPYRRPWFYDALYFVLNKINKKRWFKPRKFLKQLKDTGFWLLHGHCHSKRKWYVPGKKMIHVGVDAWNYAPVSIQNVSEIIVKVREGKYQE